MKFKEGDIVISKSKTYPMKKEDPIYIVVKSTIWNDEDGVNYNMIKLQGLDKYYYNSEMFDHYVEIEDDDQFENYED